MQKVPKVLLAVETSRYYGRGLLKGVFNYAHIHGPWTLLQSPCFYREGQGTKGDGGMPIFSSTTLSYIKKNYFDGVIVRDQTDLTDVRKLKIPVIIVSCLNEEPGFACVQTDCHQIGRLAAEHFIERGFYNFAFCGSRHSYWMDRRRAGFAEAAKESGYEIQAYSLAKLKKDHVWAKEQHIMAKWLKSLPKPIGILACNDERARDVVEACVLAELQVPEDVAVLGVDNDDFVCQMANVPVSSIELNVQQAGFEAGKLLGEMMKNPGKKTAIQKIIVEPSQVVVRQSTDVLAIEDRSVADAIKYIRQNVRQPIQVTDVADETALSRRALYEKFQHVLGCSVHQYIKRLRVEEIARLLISSDMSISDIATTMGFTSEDHIAQYFRKHKGVNPSKFRKQFVK